VFEELMRVKDEAEADVIAALAVTLSANFSAQEKIDLAAAMAVTVIDTAMYVAAKEAENAILISGWCAADAITCSGAIPAKLQN
jgi:hypothetical protein